MSRRSGVRLPPWATGFAPWTIFLPLALAALLTYMVNKDSAALVAAVVVLALVLLLGVLGWLMRGENDVLVDDHRVTFTRRWRPSLVVSPDQLAKVTFEATDGQFSPVWAGTYPTVIAHDTSGAPIYEEDLPLAGRHDQEAWWAVVAAELEAAGVQPVWNGWPPRRPMTGVVEQPT